MLNSTQPFPEAAAMFQQGCAANWGPLNLADAKAHPETKKKAFLSLSPSVLATLCADTLIMDINS